jgi:hypothetical protein
LTIPAPETKAAEPADVAESFYIPANGDTTALRLCMERILRTRKDRPVSFDMPRIETVADSVKAAAAIASAVADSNLTPSNKPQRQLLAQSGHAVRADKCPLLGVKRTSVGYAAMSANYPKWTAALAALTVR